MPFFSSSVFAAAATTTTYLKHIQYITISLSETTDEENYFIRFHISTQTRYRQGIKWRPRTQLEQLQV